MTTDTHTNTHQQKSDGGRDQSTVNDTGTDRPVVLVVEDQVAVAETYRRMLERHYTVHVATDGRRALEVLSDAVDVVLLDRMLPAMSGDEVLREIRERGFDCRVAMVTAVEPDLDIVAMGFDAYVQKPPTRDQLVETVDELLNRSRYSTELQAYYAALSKRTMLRNHEEDVTNTPEYEALEAEIATRSEYLRLAANDLTDDMTFLSAIRHIDEKSDFGGVA